MVVDAIVIFFVPYYVYAGTFDVWGNSSSSEGKSDGLWIFGRFEASPPHTSLVPP